MQTRKIFFITMGLAFSISVQAANAPKCSFFLSSPTKVSSNTSKTTNQPLKEPKMTLELLNQNYERYLKGFARSSKTNQLYEKRNQLRDKLGTLANRLESKVESNLVKIKNALRRGETREVWAIIDKPFIQVEENYMLLANRRLRYKSLKKEIAETQKDASMTWLQRTLKVRKQKKELKHTEMNIKFHLIQGLQHLEAYERYRNYLEYIQANGINGQKVFAKIVLEKSGLKNDIPSRQKTQEILQETFDGQRPKMQVILNEYLGKDYKDGSKRAFAKWGIQWKVEKEIKSLKAINFYSWFSVFNLTRLADSIAKNVRDSTRTNPSSVKNTQLSFMNKLVNTYKHGVRGVGSFIAGLFEVVSYDLQNIEAITEHLVDIISISRVHSIERVDQFERVLSIYGQQSSRKASAFLLSFARSAEHRDLLKDISYRITLEETGQISKLTKYQELKAQADSVQISLSLAKSEVRNIQEGLQSSGKISELEKVINERISELEGIEANLAPLRTEIEKIREELMNKYSDVSQRRLMVGSRVYLLAKIMDAQEVARNKPILSFDLKWTNQVQSLVINTGLYSLSAATLWWSEAPAAMKSAAQSFLDTWSNN